MNNVATAFVELYDEMVDKGLTPMVIVSCDEHPHLNVPLQYSQDGYISLLIPPRSVRFFTVDDKGMSFRTRFSGVETDVFVPLENIVLTYSRERDEGGNFLMFGELPELDESSAPNEVQKPSKAFEVIDGGKAPKPRRARPKIETLK